MLFLNVTQCSLVDGHQHFGQTCYLHLQGRKLSRAGWDEVSLKYGCIACNFCVKQTFYFWVEENISTRGDVQQMVQESLIQMLFRV
jgi:hypothetical protein